jgi:hypothetical protein
VFTGIRLKLNYNKLINQVKLRPYRIIKNNQIRVKIRSKPCNKKWTTSTRGYLMDPKIIERY